MINQILTIIINDLGATGLLVIGLYFVLYRPLIRMTNSLNIINHELGRVIDILEITMMVKK